MMSYRIALLACLAAACSSPVPRDIETTNQNDLRTATVALASLDDASLVVGPDVYASDASAARCHTQLCGMDSYCACFSTDQGARCWSDPDDCEVDEACCAERTGYCIGLRMDECADVTGTRAICTESRCAGTCDRSPRKLRTRAAKWLRELLKGAR